MKIKIDENIAGSIVDLLRDAGHDVDTVQDEGLAGAADPEVLQAATRESRLVMTLDRGFGDVRTYPPGSHGGVLVLRLDHQGPRALETAVTRLMDSVDIDDLAACIAVWRDGQLRVRRAPEADGV